MDRSELFMHPVPPSEAPDYYVIIKEPMYWKAIERKLAEHSYLNLAEFLVSPRDGIWRCKTDLASYRGTCRWFSTTPYSITSPREIYTASWRSGYRKRPLPFVPR